MLTAGLTSRGLVAPMVIDGRMNGPAFRAYVEKVLAPELRPGDVVVMDNLPAHKVAGVRQAIKAVRARLLYLPPYSPDCNQSKWRFRSSRRCYVPRHREPFSSCGRASETRSNDTRRPNAKLIWLPQDMMPSDRNLLQMQTTLFKLLLPVRS